MSNACNTRTSYSQFKIMVEFMERNGDISKATAYIRLKKWHELTKFLNANEPTKAKSEEKWRKVWSDFKNNTKRKWARINKAAKVKKLKANISTDLTDVEKRVMAIMGESITFMGESVTLDTHNDCMESNQDDDDSDNSSKNSEPNPVTSFKISPTRSSSSASIVEENPEPTSSACYKRPRRTFIRQPPREEKEEDEKSIETEIERDRDRMMYDLELERIRQRDVELKLQGRWLDFMNDCLGLLKGYLEKKNSEESRVTV